MRTLLHVGCGKTPPPTWLDGFSEVRLDIDPSVQPDITASMLDLGAIGPFDALYSSHALEHLYPHEVLVALREFRRVLKPGGAVIVVVPNLEGIKATEDVVFVSPGGPISGLDMIYGMSGRVAENPYMAHHYGFVRETLQDVMEQAGFSRCEALADQHYNLIGVGVA